MKKTCDAPYCHLLSYKNLKSRINKAGSNEIVLPSSLFPKPFTALLVVGILGFEGRTIFFDPKC
jgi:hypothetical protein